MGNRNSDIEKIVDSINQILNGNYKIHIDIDSQSEFSEIAEEINELCDDLQSSFLVIKKIKRGNFSSEIKGTRGIAAGLKTVQADFRHLIRQLKKVADGDLSQKILPLGDLSKSFNSMIISLKNAREELKKLNLKLENEAKKLKLANKRLKELDQEKTDLMNMVTHDIRNPLSSIKGFAELMLMNKDQLTAKWKKYLETIVTESNRLNALVSCFLDIAKIESGTMQFKSESVDLAELIVHAVSVYQSNAESHDILLISETHDDLPVILGDKDRIAQVFSNLLGNAVKFTPEGGKITIGARMFERSFIKIFVRDTGPGIPAEYREKIFKKFGRVEGESVRKKRGSGLGLTICKEIVENHGGRIWVESKVGKGSTFYLTLPVSQDQMKR